MNKVFKVIWNEARNAYVVVSEIAKNHGSKSCSTKKLLAMLIATGVMTCASFDVLAAEPSGTDTDKSQYVAFADPTHTLYSGNKTTIDGHEYIYDATNKYWVRKGYKLVVEENGAMHTPLSDHGKSSDVAYIGNGDKDSILQSVASMVSASGTVTNMGESLNKITASGFVGVSHSGGTAVDGTWHYIIHDPTWEGAVAQGNYEDGYVDLVGKNMPKGFVTADDNKGLIWDDDKQAYNYKGKPVDYSNVYVIDGKIGVFTNKDGSDFYKGTVFGKNNEILMTVKDDNGHFYSYWASAVTDPSATMSTYRLAEYKKDLSVLVENDEKLSRNDIKEVTLDTTQANSATIGLLRNGDTEAGAPVKGAITVTSGGGTGGSGAANDTFVKISNGTANQTFATGSKVEVNGPANAITGIKVNGVDYTIKQGSGVKVEQDAANKTTTITVDGNATTITDTHNALDSAKLDGKKLTITGKDKDSVEVDLSSIDTDTKYTAGNGITISGENNAIAVNLKAGENNLEVTAAGLALKKDLNVDSVKAGEFYMSNAGIGYGDKAYITSSGMNANNQKITNVKAGEAETDAVNVSQLNNVKAEAGKHTTLVAGENVTLDKKETDKGLEYTVNAVDTKYTAGNGITIDAAANNAISVNLKEGEVNLAVDEKGLSLNKGLKGIESVSNGAAKLELSSNPIFGATAELTNGQASVSLMGGSTKINGKVEVRQDGTIGGVTDGRSDKDAVNVSQLKKVSDTANAGWNLSTNGVTTEATNVKPGETVDFSGDKNISVSNDGTKVKVELNKNLKDIETISNGGATLTLGAMGGMVSEFTNGQGASVKLFGDTTTINGKVTVYKDGRIAGVAAGTADTDAVNVSQLKKVSDTANAGWNVSTNGGTATNVKPGETVDFSGDKNISVSHDGTKVKVELNKDLDVNSVQTNALNSKYNLSVGTMAENGIMPFFVNSTGAFYAASNKFSVDKDGNMNANSVQTNALNSKYNLSVGTANENGTVPFFVNSNGAFYAANGKLVVDKDGKLVAPEAELGKVTADEGVIGNVVLKDGVFYKHTALRDGELFVGDASGNYSQITTKGAKLGKVTIAEDGKISGVAAGEVSSTSTDAINGSQLHQTNENVAALDKRVTQNEADIATNKANIAQNAADIAANKANIAQNAADIATNKANIAQNAADIAQNKADIAQNKADIAQNKADIAQNKTDIKNLDNRVTNVEELAKKHTTVTAGDNIIVTEDTNKDGGKEYNVALKNNIDLGDNGSVTTGQTVMNNDGLKVGKDVSVTATAVTAGKTSISDEGVKVGDKTYISDKGLNANDQKVTNVAAGELSATSKDAVNGSQLYKTNQEVVNNTNRINKLGSRVNKVGAGAAALAALHPMDFDPDDKLTFSAGYGNYAGENAAAIGAYYRPDEKVMFSVAGTVGNGENMVNAGVSFALDRTNHVSNSRTALAREVIDLRGQLAVMGAKMAKMEKAFGMLDETKTKLFPDVPANHWAYEYIAKLAGNGYIEGYPDGNFGGDRLMTRYEFAAMLYRAIENGAALEEKIIKEFEPELGRIRVERISGEDGDRDKIERVRVNDTKGERDHYGNKLAK